MTNFKNHCGAASTMHNVIDEMTLINILNQPIKMKRLAAYYMIMSCFLHPLSQSDTYSSYISIYEMNNGVDESHNVSLFYITSLWCKTDSSPHTLHHIHNNTYNTHHPR